MSTDVRHEKVRRLNPLLFECDVTSHQITSGHNLKRRNIGRTNQAIDMKSISVSKSDLSCLSCFAMASIGASSGIVLTGVLTTSPLSFLRVEIVIVPSEPVLPSLRAVPTELVSPSISRYNHHQSLLDGHRTELKT